jgi:signal transduction histidine kinase
MKSDFVSNVSHELRTPVASIRVFGELLRTGRAQSAEKAREYGEYIEAESRRLSRLIDNILDFSRIESGRKEYRFVEADLHEVIADVIHTFDVRLGPQGFRITLETPPEPLPAVRIDADAIAQAFHNLLDNAVKYSGDSKAVTVRVTREGLSAAIAVQDFGIGIAPEEQRKVFERFHRVGTGLVHDVKGSGLGLSLVRHIVEAHGGTVDVVSKPGAGSVFTMRLPLRRPGQERV